MQKTDELYMTEWKTYRLGDILNFRRGHDLPKTDMVNGEIPVAGSNGIIGYHNVSTPIEPCITIGRSGNVGTPYIYDKCWAHNTVLYVDDFKGNDPLYLYYLLKTIPLASYGGGSAVPTLNRNHIHPIEIKHTPSLEEQRRIAEILGAIDDKIENNRRINDNLEQQAQALFEEIFFSDNDWEYTTLGMLTEEVKTKVRGMDAKVLSPISSGELVLSEDYFTKQVYSQDISKYIVVEPMSFAYNPARINIGSIGINSFDFVGCVSPVYVVFKTKCEYENYLRLFVKSDVFKEEVKSRAIGGVRQTLSYQDFAMITTKYPPIESIRTFNTQYNKLLGIINYNNTENRSLATLRDTLLPKLMNGEIKL